MGRPHLGFEGGNNRPSCPGSALQDLMMPSPTRELSDLSTLTPILQMRTQKKYQIREKLANCEITGCWAFSLSLTVFQTSVDNIFCSIEQ